jgi:hypothetical protein
MRSKERIILFVFILLFIFILFSIYLNNKKDAEKRERFFFKSLSSKCKSIFYASDYANGILNDNQIICNYTKDLPSAPFFLL